MKTFNKYSNIRFARIQKLSAIICLVALYSAILATGVGAQRSMSANTAAKLTEDQRILHVLNRLGFGARPGDVGCVKAVGVDKYIEQQLFPEKIVDTASEAKLRNLETLKMSTAELYEKYPQPGQLLRQLQRRDALPADLAAARDNRMKGGANAGAINNGQQKPGEMAAGEMKANDANTPVNNVAANNNAADPMNNAEYRRAVYECYKENNLRPAQFLTGELQMSRILRAVYSERQLQEVMVDFWTNHFNVFAAKGADRWVLISYDRDTIRPHTLGKVYDLLLADAQSAAMLFYLDNFQSVSPNAPQPERPLQNRNPILMSNNPQQQRPQQQQQRRGINENYARELMELHTLGVDGGDTPKEVQEGRRCFTGRENFLARGAAAA